MTTVYPELASEFAEGGVGRFSYPRPISEPPSPSSSRHTTPAASVHGSDEEDEVDDEKEVSNFFIIFLNCNLKISIKFRIKLLFFILVRRIAPNKWQINTQKYRN